MRVGISVLHSERRGDEMSELHDFSEPVDRLVYSFELPDIPGVRNRGAGSLQRLHPLDERGDELLIKPPRAARPRGCGTSLPAGYGPRGRPRW